MFSVCSSNSADLGDRKTSRWVDTYARIFFLVSQFDVDLVNDGVDG